MAELLDIEKAEKLRDILKNSTKPLAERKMKRGKGGVSGYTEVNPAVTKTFKLLVRNGYGANQISDKTPDGEARLNEFSRILSDAKKAPGSAAALISEYDRLTLSQMVYAFNKRAKMDDRYMVEVVESKCLLGILERAIELGPHNRLG